MSVVEQVFAASVRNLHNTEDIFINDSETYRQVLERQGRKDLCCVHGDPGRCCLLDLHFISVLLKKQMLSCFPHVLEADAAAIQVPNEIPVCHS